MPKWKHYLNLTTYYGTIIWENLVIFGLSLQSAHGLFTSIMFIIDDYPILEQQFSQKAINTTEVTQIITEAIGLMLGTIINILFAIRLSKSQERLSHIFELILGTILIIWYGHVVEYLQQLDYTLIASLLADLNLDRLLPL